MDGSNSGSLCEPLRHTMICINISDYDEEEEENKKNKTKKNIIIIIIIIINNNSL
jgi:hypothetical protein